MVRAKSALDAGIPLSFQSDLPMGPSSPLKLASFAVNRTVNGIVYGLNNALMSWMLDE
jgi:predicted amidohydrolase YtcJ